MLSSHLKAMGLNSSPTSPCLFMGILVEGEAPIYMGVYVNNLSISVQAIRLKENLKSYCLL
jgi:hypothetical protein